MTFSGKDIQALEQLGPMMRDHYCPMVGLIFKGYLDAGFTREESLQLVQSTMLMMWGLVQKMEKGGTDEQ